MKEVDTKVPRFPEFSRHQLNQLRIYSLEFLKTFNTKYFNFYCLFVHLSERQIIHAHVQRESKLFYASFNRKILGSLFLNLINQKKEKVTLMFILP